MTPGYAIVWTSNDTPPRTHYLSKQSTWSLEANDAQVFETWAIAKSRSRAFKGSDVVEAWV